MRILLTADPEIAVPPVGYGGIERIVDGLVRSYREAGHEVGLVARSESTAPAQRLFAWPRSFTGGRFAALRNFSTIRRAADAWPPDVIHSFSRLANLIPLLPRPVPKVMSYQRHTGGRQITIATWLARSSLHFTGCSAFISAQGAKAGGHWTTIHNFIDADRIAFSAAVTADAPLLFLSRVDSVKGADWAIAIARGAGRRLVIAGNRSHGKSERAFWDRNIAPHLDQNGITYVGEVDDRQKSLLLTQAAALLVPIQWEEPFGIVFAEALAAGTPVISCPRGALPEIITDGKQGFLIRSLNEGIRAVERIPTLSRAACRDHALRHFSRAHIAEQYLALYRRITRQPLA